MELTYELSRKDYNIFVKHCHKRIKRQTRKNSWLFFLIILLFCLIVGVLLGYFFDLRMQDIHLPTIVLCFIFVLLFMIFFLYDSYKMIPRCGGWTLGQRKISLTKDGLAIESKLYKTIVMWDAVEDIVKTKNQIVIFVDTNSAFIIPTRIFSSPAEKEEFLAELFKYVKKRISSFKG